MIIMKKTFLFSCLIFMTATILFVSCGSKTKTEIPDASGEELVNQLWTNLQNADTAADNSFMADGFQAVHEDGANDKAAELELIAGLNIDSYTISNLICTQNNDVIVATYIVSVEETIEGQRLSKDPAARMSVFMVEEGSWKWISHANLKPLENEVPVTEETDSIQ
ncbi:MAG: hypothetical protein C0592_11475 [Marinilabiliales bacterium]|nr:MAG: hypothetical protein C0592_11475 [Marinilabiliales bacterium]